MRLFASQPRKSMAWVEILGVTIGLYALAYGIRPADPLLVGSAFPWVWLGPMLLALRYGVIAGGISLAILWVAHWAWWLPAAPAGTTMPASAFFGGFVFTFLCGQFCEMWSFRVHRAAEHGSFLEGRLAGLSRDHYLLHLSHDRVLQDMVMKPVTLRDSLARIRGETMQAEVMTVPNAGPFLRLVAHYCSLETASLHAVIRGAPETNALASVGEPHPLALEDPLVARALKSNELVHVRLESAEARAASRYLVCAPAVDSQGHARFFLTVEMMRFTALTLEGLQTLSVLLGYYADSLSMAHVIRPLRQSVPHVESGFALEMMRLTRIANETGLESGLVALTIEPGPQARAVWDQLLRSGRKLDVAWPIVVANRYALLTIMPLAGSAAVESYLLRIERLMKERFGLDFESGVVTPHTLMIDGEPPGPLLEAFLQRCRV